MGAMSSLDGGLRSLSAFLVSINQSHSKAYKHTKKPRNSGHLPLDAILMYCAWATPTFRGQFWHMFNIQRQGQMYYLVATVALVTLFRVVIVAILVAAAALTF